MELKEVKMISCACGCGELIKEYDSGGCKRRYVSGHYARTIVKKRKTFNLFKITTLTEKFKFQKKSYYSKAKSHNAKLCFYYGKNEDVAFYILKKFVREEGFKIVQIKDDTYALCMSDEEFLEYLNIKRNNSIEEKKLIKEERERIEEKTIFDCEEKMRLMKEERKHIRQREEFLRKPWKDSESLFCDKDFLEKPVSEGGLGMDIRKCDEL